MRQVSGKVRIRAFQPLAAQFAVHVDNPEKLLEAHFRTLLTGKTDGNPRLSVETVGFMRLSGDWAGVLITPDALLLCLLPGGGQLWGEIPVGQARYLALAGETLRFVADEVPGIGSFQLAVLLEPATPLADQAAARQLAERMMQGLGWQPPLVALQTDDSGTAPEGVSRRGFLRRLVGRR